VSARELPDQQARERIASELDANLVVEAGAGTGKTTVLVERVVSLLATGRVSVDELVVITFTEKAAAELSTRVRDALERRATTAEPQERERLLEAARGLYRAHIETIHSFAAALLRERPVEAPIDPLFEVLDELAAGLAFDAAYERFQDELFSEERPELELALRRGFTIRELREACGHVHAHRYLLPLAHPGADPGDHDAVLKSFQSIANELQELLAKHQPGEDKAVEYVEGIIRWVGALAGLAVGESERRIIFTSARTHGGVGSKDAWGEDCDRMRELQRDYKRALEEANLRLRTNALLAVLPHVERFVREYEAERKRAGRADFDDLLFWVRDLLRDSQPARRYFRRRFRAVLIDEFQDTDPVQAELALLLTSDEEPGADWRALRPAPGRLTVVGDPKQSIYRFRRADIAVYDDFKEGALSGAEDRISTNFRSNPQLLAALNHAFDQIFVAAPRVQPRNAALQVPPDASDARRAPVLLATGSVEGNADVVREAEAHLIAGMLHAARRDGWEVRDREDGAWRPSRFGDMAILLPSRTGLDHYLDALAQAGVPYRHEGARDFFQREEVRDLVWVLSAIDDPTDRVALVGALRSSAFAVSDEQLVIHVASAGSLSYRSRSEGPSEAANEALAQLRDLHDMRTKLSLAEVVRRVVERTRLVEFALTRRDGEQGAANLLAIVDEARLFAAAGGGGLRPFIRHLRDSMENEAIEIEATVAEETDDVVRVMTMHGAKGLEYPIVALANLGTKYTPKAAPVPREGESFLHFRVGADSPGRNGHFATPGWAAVWEDEKRYVLAERLRMLYVAATRARDHLLVPCVAGRENADPDQLLGAFVHALPDDPALVEQVDAAAFVPPVVPEEVPGRASEIEIDAAVTEREAWAIDHDELLARARRERDIETASSRERAQGPLAAEVSTFGAALVLGEGPPIPVGDAVHMLMERITLPGAEDLEAIAEDVCLEGDIAHELDDVIAMCRACLEATSVQRALAGGVYWREVPFVLSRDGSSNGTAARAGARATDERANVGHAVDPFTGPLVNGRVDMVHRDGDELVVIDYKTDRDVTRENAENHAREKHSGQAEVYAQALAAATGLRVREVVFVYCKAGVEVAFLDGEVVRGAQ
jgi:ATP-dependent helicase/nuclease subunit A